MLPHLKNFVNFKLKGDSIHHMVRYLLNNRAFIDDKVFLKKYNTELQRPLCWNLFQKQQIVWSAFLERHIPAISYVVTYEDKNDIMQIIDGKQRLNALLDFAEDKFFIEYEGTEYYFSDLPEEFKRRFLGYNIHSVRVIENVNVEITDDDKIEWFNRINFAGTPQDKEHMHKLKTLSNTKK